MKRLVEDLLFLEISSDVPDSILKTKKGPRRPVCNNNDFRDDLSAGFRTRFLIHPLLNPKNRPLAFPPVLPLPSFFFFFCSGLRVAK